MTNEEREILVNTIRVAQSSQSDFDYQLPDEGPGIFGLVKVKNFEEFNEKSGKMVDKLRFIFRSQSNPKAFVNLSCTSIISDRSNLFKLLRSMSNYKFKVEDGEVKAFSLIENSIGSWWEVVVVHVKGKRDPSKTYANVADFRVSPVDQKRFSVSVEDYFKDNTGEGKVELQTGFEQYADAVTETFEGEEDELPF